MKKILLGVSVVSLLMTGCTLRPINAKTYKPEKTVKTIKTTKTVEIVEPVKNVNRTVANTRVVRPPVPVTVNIPVKKVIDKEKLSAQITKIVKDVVQKNCVQPKPIIKTVVKTQTKPVAPIRVNIIVKQEKAKPSKFNCGLDERAPIDPSVDTY